MFRKILQLFPSGIIFYSKTKGLFYKNKYWMDLLDRFSDECGLSFWKSKINKHKEIKIDPSKFENNDAYIGDKETQLALNSLYLRDNNNSTLMDEIISMHSQVNQKNPDFRLDEFILHKNHQLNEYEIKNVNGRHISIFETKFLSFSFSSEDNSILVVINDISERVRLRESKISEMLKSIMLWSISHELRTPVNQINGVLTLLLPTLSTPEQQNLIRIANSSTELLKMKVDDMLDFYEVEAGGFKTEKCMFDPREPLAYLKTLFTPIIDKSNLKILFYVHENIPQEVYHDKQRIKQILVNLMSNAVKYTNRGIISIIADWKDDPDDSNKGSIQYSVSDTGWGIPKHKRSHIFSFLNPSQISQINSEFKCDIMTTKLAGTGLGISYKIAQALNSLIRFTSSVGTGSRFWFRLDAEKSAQESDRHNYQLHKTFHIQKVLILN